MIIVASRTSNLLIVLPINENICEKRISQFNELINKLIKQLRIISIKFFEVFICLTAQIIEIIKYNLLK